MKNTNLTLLKNEDLLNINGGSFGFDVGWLISVALFHQGQITPGAWAAYVAHYME